MAVANAKVTNLPISARKARLVADMVRGKNVLDARDILTFTRKAAAEPIRKLLNSAVANAEHAAETEHARIDTDEMVVSLIRVNEGRTLNRWRASARGRGMRIRHRSCHVELVISDAAAPRNEA